jgi:dTDP-4-amino-4,6-dideoxygalactose transaminase
MKNNTKNIPYSTQSIDRSDVSAVVETLNSGFLSQGPTTLNFEKQMSKLTKSKYAIVLLLLCIWSVWL